MQLPTQKTNHENLIQDIQSNDELEAIKDQVESEVLAWTAEYHAAGKRGAELSDSDIQTAVAVRWARYVIACRL